MKHIAAILLLAFTLSGQTLNLSGPATVRPGQTVTMNVSLAAPSVDLAAMQWSIALPSGYTATGATAGAASTAAGKALYCNTASTNCLTVGVNSSVYGAGVVVSYSIVVPAIAPPGTASVSMPGAAPLIGVLGATLAGGSSPLTVGTAWTFQVLAPTDLNGDGKTDLLDLQILIQQILNGGPVAGNDQNGDGLINVRDAAILSRAVVGP